MLGLILAGNVYVLPRKTFRQRYATFNEIKMRDFVSDIICDDSSFLIRLDLIYYLQ